MSILLKSKDRLPHTYNITTITHIMGFCAPIVPVEAVLLYGCYQSFTLLMICGSGIISLILLALLGFGCMNTTGCAIGCCTIFVALVLKFVLSFISMTHYTNNIHANENSSTTESRKAKLVLCIDTSTYDSSKMTLQSFGSPLSSSSSSSYCCAICLQDYKDGDVISNVKACGHPYHSDCLSAWVEKSMTCPYCRHDLNATSSQTSKNENITNYFHLVWKSFVSTT